MGGCWICGDRKGKGEKEFWTIWNQNVELGQAACASSAPATWTMGAGWTCVVCMHCPRRLLCWRKESGSTGGTILSALQEGCGHILPRGQKEEANVEIEANEMEQELPEDKPLERVHQDEQSQELAPSGRKQNSNCQVLFEPAR